MTTTEKRRTRKRKTQHRGWGVDIQNFLAKFGELYWPGYQYMGPETKLEKRLKRGDFGINRLDRIANQHDIDYAKLAICKTSRQPMQR